jgi:hypothetical protein
MDCTAIYNTSLLPSQPVSAETLAAIHDSAKQRAQALRREAVSGLIDDVIASVFHRGDAARRAATARAEAVCHS